MADFSGKEQKATIPVADTEGESVPLDDSKSSVGEGVVEATMSSDSRSDRAISPEKHSEALRTERWDFVEPMRAQATPWRDRRVPGSDAHFAPSEDRRFRGAADRVPAALRDVQPAASSEPDLLDQPKAAPQLTRAWGLLSRFADPDVAPEAAVAQADRSARDRR